ncbi:MAG: lipase-like protein [Ramlibacter sp.]|jgi:predicted alpha/beta hydrolase family esterase|uniref:alpha/beta fold hydrolase n=1 Tax=Ramlibacter sp. TaxID=1917967 RepID=UPI00261A42BB|nr:alpha/beta fold hydrolase [Ramlibacter sp.]MDB5749828.1 lipase-like protein [Ramlibacter sp.]
MPQRSLLAWLLRTALAVQAALLLSFLLWRWPISPVQAVAGALAIVGIAPLVLAIQFVLLRVVARSDSAVPQASAMELARAWIGEVGSLVRVFYWRLPFRWQAPPDFLDPACTGRTGAVLIHGFVCNRGFWAPWLRRLRQQQQAHVAVNLEPVFGSIDDYVPIIEAAVQRVTRLTGAAPVLICHSMGGLAARAWLRAAGDGGRIAHLVTIGSPHHGTWLGRFSNMPNGRQMRQRGAWIADLERAEALSPLPPSTCWYSNCDNIVFPPSTAMLAHARNRFLPGEAHVAMAFHPDVMTATFRLLEAPTRPT